MKNKVILYLFIFSVLINIFTYMYFTNKEKYETERITKMQKTVKTLKASLTAEKAKSEEANYFSLEGNDNALEYFYEQDIPALTTKIKEGISQLNANPNGNPLVQYGPMDGNPFTINKVKILNHRWIIADFSNGSAWGEVLIKYFVEDDGKITYEAIQTLLHSNTVN